MDENRGVHLSLSEAHSLACTWPSSSVTASRKALQLALQHWHQVQGFEVQEKVADALASPEFRAAFEKDFLDHCYAVRDVGNVGAHTADEVIDEFAIKIFEIVSQIVIVLIPPPIQTKAEDIDEEPNFRSETTHHGGPIPAWDTIHRWQLTPGHLHLVQKLCEAWTDWTIYVESHAYGYKPDVVAVHPRFGIYVFEVKDYNLDCYRYEDDGFKVRARKDGKWYVTKCPIEQVSRVRAALRRGPLNGLPDGVCKTALYVHGPEIEDVRRVFGRRTRSHPDRRGEFDPILLTEGTLQTFFTTQTHTVSSEFPSRLPYVSAILVPSEHRLGEWARIKLRPRQEAAAKSRWDQGHDVSSIQLEEQGDLFGEGPVSKEEVQKDKQYFRRFRAPAGAGKSLVLCDRAARACHHEKRTLICCFNITLVNYLYEIVSNRTQKEHRTHFEVRHFHGLLGDLQIEVGLRVASESKEGHSDFEPQDYAEPSSAELDTTLGLVAEESKYDAIYVDEVQDFDASWLTFLVGLLKPGGEMVIAGDLRQDIYSRKQLDSSKLPFRGRWRQIHDTSERTPAVLVPFLNEFAARQSLGDHEDHKLEPKQEEMDFGTMMLWANCASDEDLVNRAVKLVGFLMKKHGKHPESIAILVPSHQLGSTLVEHLSRQFGAETVQDVFGEEHRKKKRTFFMGGGKFKVSTIHSFKGWDLETVIILWKALPDPSASLLYTALTRSRVNVSVCNSDPSMAHYSTTFPRMAGPSN